MYRAKHPPRPNYRQQSCHCKPGQRDHILMNSFLLGSQDQPTSSPVLLYIKPSPTGWPFSFTLLLIFRVIKQKHCQRHCRPRRSLILPNLQLDWRKNLIVAICTHLNNFIASLDSCNKLWAALTAVTTCSQL